MTSTVTNPRGKFHLCLALLLIGVVWLVVLPWLAERPKVDAYLMWLEERKIDPSARYYTDVEAMEPILKKLDRRRRK